MLREREYMSKIVFIILWLIGMGIGLPVKAQNNPFKIDDSLYKLYLQAFKYRTSQRCLGLSDTLFNEANRLGDKKAACLAKTIPMSYYMNSDDSLAFAHAVRDLQQVSRQNGYLQYYYHGYGSYIIWILRRGYLFKALQLTKDMYKQAQADQNEYGFYSCLRRQGDIYRLRGDARSALACYKEALRFQQRYMPEQDSSQSLTKIAGYYRRLNNADSLELAYKCALEAMHRAKTYELRTGARMELCLILFQMGRIDEFTSLYDTLKVEMDKAGRVQKNNIYLLRTYRAVVEQRWDDAIHWAKQQDSPSAIYALLRYIFDYKGDYRMALYYDRMFSRYCDSVSSQIRSTDIGAMTLQLAEERMKIEAQDLEMKHAALMLENARLELEQTRSQAVMEKARTENNRLTLENRELELEQLDRALEQQNVLQREERMSAQFHIVLLIVGLAFLMVIIGLLIVQGYRHRALLIALRKNNDELLVARDKAEQSDKIKTEFMQNVSHEIRTPLNAIVGFSQLLTIPGVQVNDEEKKEFGNMIQRNSELLTTLINDVLDLANLESGKYVMHLAPCQCNDVCRAAIASVEYRKTHGVKMYFTSEVSDDYVLTTNAARLQQVLINFLTNAEKNTSEGEIHLHCSLSETPGKMTFSVTDTGPGVPTDKADMIFQRFYKVDSFKQGTGLGLNICSVIAERLQGEVKYDKNYTQGARFLFIHPLDLKG